MYKCTDIILFLGSVWLKITLNVIMIILYKGGDLCLLVFMDLVYFSHIWE